MKNNQKEIFSVNLSFFILMSLVTLNFGFSVHPDETVKREELEPQFVNSELDLYPISDVFNRMSSENELIETETPDPVPQFNSLSIGNVLTLLRNIQLEFSSSKKKTADETQDLKNEISELRENILDQENEILKDRKEIKEKIKSNHEEVKKELAELSKDLKSQNTVLFNSSQLQNQQKENPIESKNSSSFSALTAPQFYYREHFQGSIFTPSSDDWKTECVHLSYHDSASSSLKTGGHCLLICQEKKCKSRIGYFVAKCKIVNTDTAEVADINDIGLYRIQSFRRCNEAESQEKIKEA